MLEGSGKPGVHEWSGKGSSAWIVFSTVSRPVLRPKQMLGTVFIASRLENCSSIVAGSCTLMMGEVCGVGSGEGPGMGEGLFFFALGPASTGRLESSMSSMSSTGAIAAVPLLALWRAACRLPSPQWLPAWAAFKNSGPALAPVLLRLLLASPLFSLALLEHSIASLSSLPALACSCLAQMGICGDSSARNASTQLVRLDCRGGTRFRPAET